MFNAISTLPIELNENNGNMWGVRIQTEDFYRNADLV
jgi:hypothetical protein